VDPGTRSPARSHLYGVDHGIVVEVDLTSLGLSGPVQVVAVRGDRMIPAWGSLLTDGDDGRILVTFEVDAPGIDLGTGETVTLSGDRSELGAWAGHAVALADDGAWPDLTAGDDRYTAEILLDRGGSIAYKYLLGTPGDPSWDGVEFEGPDRSAWVQDADGSGRIWLRDALGVPGGSTLDP
jgi:hypothetical protein